MRCSIALDNMTRTIPLIDEDQKVALLHAPFKGTTLFGGEMVKLQRVNTERANALTVFLAPSALPTSYAQRGRGQGRFAPSSLSATITKPAKDGLTTMTVTVPQDSNKHKVESRGNSPCPKCTNKGESKGTKKQSE